MADSALQEAMRKLSKGLANSLQESGVISHALTKGEVRESEVHDAFRPHIPRSFSLSSGLVTNAAGEQSLQQDLIISNDQIAPPFITAGGIGVHPIETIHGVVEIKSDGTPANVRNGVAKGASVAELLPNGPRQPPPEWPAGVAFESRIDKPYASIICLRPAASLQSVAAAFAEANFELDRVNRAYSLLLLGQALITWRNERGQLVGPLGGTELWVVEFGDDALMMFYGGLLRGIWEYRPPPFGLNSYTEAASEGLPPPKAWRVETDGHDSE
jgi:hypothetical protein